MIPGGAPPCRLKLLPPTIGSGNRVLSDITMTSLPSGLNQIDPLDIDLFELLLTALLCESGDNKDHKNDRHDGRISLQESQVFLQFSLHNDPQVQLKMR